MAETTPYDTGDVLEPQPWHVQPQNLPDPEEAARYGRVDFDDDEGATALTVRVDRNAARDGYTLHIENVGVELAVAADDSAPPIEAPSRALREKVAETISRLRTPIEQQEVQVFWNHREALILVPGEKHVRKQQLILVNDEELTMSAVVKTWGNGVRDTRIE